MSGVKTWRYSVPTLNSLEGWAILFLDNAGCFAALSDYGDWTYRWNARGIAEKDMRYFILSCDDGYLLQKLNPHKEYDSDATLIAAKELIIGMRRERQLDVDEARNEWISLSDCDSLRTEIDFYRWTEMMDLGDVSDLYRTKHSEQARAFLKHCLPRLRMEIKNDLGL
jgi:hypothetical protein